MMDIYKMLQSIAKDANGRGWKLIAQALAEAIGVNPKLFLRCRYCGIDSEDDKGEWGIACRECKAELTENCVLRKNVLWQHDTTILLTNG